MAFFFFSKVFESFQLISFVSFFTLSFQSCFLLLHLSYLQHQQFNSCSTFSYLVHYFLCLSVHLLLKHRAECSSVSPPFSSFFSDLFSFVCFFNPNLMQIVKTNLNFQLYECLTQSDALIGESMATSDVQSLSI